MRLIGKFIYVKLFELLDRTVIYRQFPKFKPIDKHLRKGPNPYSIKKAFPYGETPLRVVKQIALTCQIPPGATLIELGCGRGRAAAFFAHYAKIHTIGIDFIPEFLKSAPNTTFLCQDMLDADLSAASWIYLYGTGFDEELLQAISQKIRHQKVITVSEPLPNLTVLKTFTARYPWGKAELFLSQKNT
jgi:SAM-dependent methyltransferase